MACSNCFNGCSEITSDQCVRYTGIDVPMLGIKNGDSLSFVEQSLIEFLTSALDGTGIHMPINSTIICDIVKDFLPTCGELSLVDFTTALIKSVCSLKEQLDALAGDVAAIEAPYTTGCLTVASGDSVTHQVVQAIITKLCTVQSDLTALAINLDTNYVKIADLCSLVVACIEQNNPGGNSKLYTKMVPYTVVEYYGPTSNFDASGAGIGDWEKIYLCNGQNNTPDKRGRVGVGATNTPGTLPMSSDVAPSVGLNPTYSFGTTAGSNGITLTAGQMPSHNHPGSGVVTTILPNPHRHNLPTTGNVLNPGPFAVESGITVGTIDTSDVTLAATSVLTIAAQGSNGAHINYQPGLACYYIMYRP